CPTDATRSSVASADCADVLTNATCGLSTGTCDAMLVAAVFSSVASLPVFGLLNAYDVMFGIVATETPDICSACGGSPAVFHAVSGSSGADSVERYRPTHPLPIVFGGFAVDQISVPEKCERLEFS